MYANSHPRDCSFTQIVEYRRLSSAARPGAVGITQIGGRQLRNAWKVSTEMTGRLPPKRVVGLVRNSHRERMAVREHFVTSVLAEEKVFLIGDDDELSRLVERRPAGTKADV